MRTFRDFLKDVREDYLSREQLNEMPFRNKVDKNWSGKTIQDLWALAEDEVSKVGSIGGEEVFSVSLGSSLFYYFLVKQGVPVFAASFEKRLDILGLQEDTIAKGSSVNSAENLYKFVCKAQRKSIISSVSHSRGMEKVWVGFMKRHKYEVFDDDTGELVDDSSVYPSNKVVRIFFK